MQLNLLDQLLALEEEAIRLKTIFTSAIGTPSEEDGDGTLTRYRERFFETRNKISDLMQDILDNDETLREVLNVNESYDSVGVLKQAAKHRFKL